MVHRIRPSGVSAIRAGLVDWDGRGKVAGRDFETLRL
jgi:hypothetical protein